MKLYSRVLIGRQLKIAAKLVMLCDENWQVMTQFNEKLSHCAVG